eukprot:g21884.t1
MVHSGSMSHQSPKKQKTEGPELFRLTHGKDAKTSVEVNMNGATVTSWKVGGKEVIFLSKKAVLNTPGKAIRGGIPLVFPQFGPGPIQQHGFARNVVWKHDGKVNKAKDTGDVSTTFVLTPNDYSKAMWSYQFKLEYELTLQANHLAFKFTVRNEDSKKFDFTALLHTYFKVDSIDKIRVSGLKGVTYMDKVAGKTVVEESGDVKITSETDRIYENVKGDVTLKDGGAGDLVVKTSGFCDIVLWNPWVEK